MFVIWTVQGLKDTSSSASIVDSLFVVQALLTAYLFLFIFCIWNASASSVQECQVNTRPVTAWRC